MIIGQPLKFVSLFAGKVDVDDRFALISAGVKVWKKTLLDVECNEIFQEFSVLTDISTTTYQAEIPTAFQGMLFLVIDQVMVAKYPEPPKDQKETLLKVFEWISHDKFLTPETRRLL